MTTSPPHLHIFVASTAAAPALINPLIRGSRLIRWDCENALARIQADAQGKIQLSQNMVELITLLVQLLSALLMETHFTGARRQEVFWLTWAQIDWEARCIFVRGHSGFTIKEGREKALPLAPALLSFLQQEHQANPTEVWLFDDGAGKLVYHSASALTLAIRRHMQAIGFAGRGIKPIHGHRAALASRLWSGGVDLTTVQKALGHSSITVTQGYLPATTPVVRAALNSMKDVGVAKILAKTGNKTGNNP